MDAGFGSQQWAAGRPGERQRFRAVLFPLLLMFATVLTNGGTARVQAGLSNSLMDISRDGRYLACSNRDSGTVTVVDLQTGQKQAEVAVGSHPEGVTFIGTTYQLAVAVYDTDEIVFLDGPTGKIVGRTSVFDEPYGLVSTPDGRKIYVTLDYPGQVIEIDVASRCIERTFSLEPFQRGLALTASGTELYATSYYSATLSRIDLKTGQVSGRWDGGANDNLSRQLTLHPQRPKAYLPHLRSRVTVAHGAGSIFPLLTVISTDDNAGQPRHRIPLDSFIGARVTCNPWETALSPDSRTLVVVFAGTDDLFVCNVINDDYREATYRASLAVGSNPRAVRFAPNGKTFYVYNALDFNVVAYDAATLKQTAEFAVTDCPLSEEVLLGKRLFYTAHPPMTSRLWISCASCHPDGQPDGRTWQNPEGLRNTQSLAGMAFTHPIHWSADRDEVQDFEHTVRGPLMQGRGLLRGPLQPSLEAPNKGLSAALDALSAYSNTHRVSLSPHAKGGLSPAARRGQQLFHSETTGCAKCHSGPFYTDSSPSTRPFAMHDVGTGQEDPTELMGTRYDTPTLLGIYRTAPYLHDGTAATLTDVLTTANRSDKHGRTSHLTADEVADLVEFLKSLPFEDPVPAARKAGLPEVTR